MTGQKETAEALNKSIPVPVNDTDPAPNTRDDGPRSMIFAVLRYVTDYKSITSPPHMKPVLFSIVVATLLCSLAACSDPDSGSSGSGGSRPNVLLIVLDDLAFNDLGLLGSEIRTPNIDALAREGVFLTNFHVSPNCSPTRAMLFSGVDTHNAGLGNMFEDLAPNQEGHPGYEGYLNFQVAALSELFLEAGYNTYMTGKWHLGLTRETSPAARGFEKSFAPLQGGGGAFSNMLPIVGPGKSLYRVNGEQLDTLPEDFYSTKFYTELMQEYIGAGPG